MHLLLYSISALVVVFAFSEVKAQNCDNALIVSSYAQTDAYHSDWRLAKYVREGEYNELKKGISGSAKIYGVPIGGSYDEFRKSYSSFEEQTKTSLTIDQARQVYWTGLSNNAENAYTTCLQQNVYNSPGLHLAVVEGSSDAVLVKLKWHMPGTVVPIRVEWTATVDGKPDRTEFRPGETYISVPRPKAGSIILGATSENGLISEIVRIAAMPPAPVALIPNCMAQDPVGTCIRCEFSVNETIDENQYSVERTCPKMPFGKLIQASVHLKKIEREGSGENCWLNINLAGPDNKGVAITSQTASCALKDRSGTSAFALPPIEGQGSARLYAGHCGRASCRVEGVLAIYSAAGAR